jgi:hypothetical protein
VMAAPSIEVTTCSNIHDVDVCEMVRVLVARLYRCGLQVPMQEVT